MKIPKLVMPSIFVGNWTGFATPIGIVVRYNTGSITRHEECHFRQWWRYWVIGFVLLYGYYLIKYGYWNNPLEIEARAAE